MSIPPAPGMRMSEMITLGTRHSRRPARRRPIHGGTSASSAPPSPSPPPIDHETDQSIARRNDSGPSHAVTV